MPINQTDPVTQGTRRNLIQGLRAKAMPGPAIDAALRQAASFSERLLAAYESEIALGEVGAAGSARASDAPILGVRTPTVLMYGRVQSGKTAAMILTSALCLDNGFRVIVVLTADNLALVEQTANRFKALDGPRVFSSIRDDSYEWEGQEDELREDIANDGLVLVCAKDSFHLSRIIRFLQQIEAPSYPALILDDEADAATPDTTLAARSSGRSNAPQFASTINRRVIENLRPGEEGESIVEMFSHSLYVQVTATPYLLFLQRSTSAIRPNVTFLLEPGQGYCGGEAFFGTFDARATTPPAPPLCHSEARAINLRPVPPGLAASVEFFLLAAAAKSNADQGQWPAEGFKHLSHSSHRINQHTVVAGHIERHLTSIRRLLREDARAASQRFTPAYNELERTAPALPPLSELLGVLPEAIRQAEYIRVNSDTDVPRYGPRLNFLIGGNILGRGLTIDDLLVTYYVRQAQVSQMDTVWQHARMYGYRDTLMPYSRVFLPRRVAARFKEIHEAEEELRQLLRREADGETVLVRMAIGTRPTRPNATEPSALRVVGAGLDQLFPLYMREDQATAMQIRQMLSDAAVPLDLADRSQRTTFVSLNTAFELVELIPIRDDDRGRWSPGTISALMESFRDQYRGRSPVYVRGLEKEEQPPGGWIRGRLSGDEIAVIRRASQGVPAIALMYSGDEERPNAWYPTLVLPPGTTTYIVNPL